MKRRVAGTVLAASLIAGSGVAAVVGSPMIALASDDTSEPWAVSKAHSPTQWAMDALKGLVDNGTITGNQRDAVVQALEDAHVGRGHGQMMNRPFDGFKIAFSSEVANVLGISSSELRAAHAEGKSLAKIAEEQNVEVKKVIDVLVAQAHDRIDQSVTAGRITQEEADERKAQASEKITEMVSTPRPVHGDRIFKERFRELGTPEESHRM